MAYFLVTYDLMKNKDYSRIIDRLKELEAHRPALSVWFVELPNTAKEVCDHLAEYVDEDDKLVVVEFSKRPVTKMAFKGTAAWLDARF